MGPVDRLECSPDAPHQSIYVSANGAAFLHRFIEKTCPDDAMKIFDLTNPEAARGYDAVTGGVSLEYTPRLFLVKADDGAVTEADFDAPPHLLTAGGIGCNPEEISPDELATFVQTPPPPRLPDSTVIPDGLTEAQTIAAWHYRSIAESCILRPDSEECLAAVLRSGYDLFTDPLSGERNVCLLRAVVVDCFLGRAAPDIPLLLELFPSVEDRKTIQEMVLRVPDLDNDVAAEYIAVTGSEPGADRVRASLLHQTVIETLLHRKIQNGQHERVAAWMNRDFLPLSDLKSASSLPGTAHVAAEVKNVAGAQELYDEAVRHGNTKVCLALWRRRDVEVDAGGLTVIIKRLKDLDVIYRSIRAQQACN